MAEPVLQVLVADDDPLSRKLVRCLLEHAGHQVREVDSGAAAVTLLQQHRFDLLLMDGRMPGLDGPEAARTIRALSGPVGDIPIIAVTGASDEEDQVRYLDAGINAYLIKPIETDSLLNTVAAVMA